MYKAKETGYFIYLSNQPGICNDVRGNNIYINISNVVIAGTYYVVNGNFFVYVEYVTDVTSKGV